MRMILMSSVVILTAGNFVAEKASANTINNRINLSSAQDVLNLMNTIPINNKEDDTVSIVKNKKNQYDSSDLNNVELSKIYSYQNKDIYSGDFTNKTLDSYIPKNNNINLELNQSNSKVANLDFKNSDNDYIDKSLDNKYLNVSNKDTKCMAEAIVREAGGEPLKGQIAVAHVIRNRSIISGKSPCSVIQEKIGGRYQFSFMLHRKKITNTEQYENAKDIATQVIVSNVNNDITKGSQFFHRCSSGKTHGSMRFQKKIGNHCFYNSSKLRDIEPDEFITSNVNDENNYIVLNEDLKQYRKSYKKTRKYHNKNKISKRVIANNFNPSIHRPIDLE